MEVDEGLEMVCSVREGVYLGGVEVGGFEEWNGWRRWGCVWEWGLYKGEDGFLGLEMEKYHLFMLMFCVLINDYLFKLI